jgi:hypothetical protein
VILEAFAQYLHSADRNLAATDVLGKWLWEKLNAPAINNVDRVLHCEMTFCAVKTMRREGGEEDFLPRYAGTGSKESYVFKGKSDSGRRLLRSLYEYCLSYEQQKWARFVHGLKASDFNGRPPEFI